MNAEIFYLEEQESLASELKALLRAHIYPGIDITLSRIQVPAYDSDPSELGRRYVKLLQASIPPEKGLQLGVNRLVTFGYRFYIEVYYALTYAAFRYGGRTFGEHEFRYFFPAVAIRDRMVMIPAGLGQRLEQTSETLSPFNPLEMGGVAEVDFQNEQMVGEAMARVGGQVRDDFVRELKAYARYQAWGEVDLPQLASDLEVEPGFIYHTLQAETLESAFYQKLSCEVDSDRVALGRWNKMTLTIRNDSDNDLSDLQVSISGPVSIRPTRIRATVPAHSSADVAVAAMPEDSGDFPLEITFVLPDDRLFADLLPVHHIWLQCE